MTTSIMMVTYNRLELTQRMLRSLFQNTDVPFRLIIVDNGSTDGTIQWLQSMPQDQPLCQSYDIHLNENNLGIAKGRNLGLQIADRYQDDWLATVDNDVEFPAGWLRECIEIMETVPKYSVGLNMESVQYPISTIHGKTFQVKPQGNLGTACAVFNRKLHQEIGFFCTEFGLYGEEDADFFFRARIAGYRLGYLLKPGIHFGEGELDTGEYRKFKDSCRGNNIANFQKRCHQYMGGQCPIYLDP